MRAPRLPGPAALLRRAAAWLASVALLFAALPVHALDCNVIVPAGVSPYAVSDFVTGLRFGVFGGCIGATGMAFDGQNKVFVVDAADGALYEIEQAGGATRINPEAYPPQWCPRSLAFSADFQHLYMARSFCGQGGDIVEISAFDGHVIRTVAQGTPCATGLAVDPLSGDLFVSSPCGPGEGSEFIYRVANPLSAFPFVTVFSQPGRAHGLAFGTDGTLWTSVFNYDTNVREIVRISGTGGTGAIAAGVVTVLATAPAGDPLNGVIAVVPAANEADPTHPGVVYVLLESGGMRTVDLRGASPTTAVVATGGSLQSGLIAGRDGCLYASSMDRVYRVAATDGSCNLGVVARPTNSVAQEYYNTLLGHYFMTANDGEKFSVETGGAGPGWSSTGYFFNVGGNAAVCRFYGNRNINPATGQPYGPNSHFYTIETPECNAVRLDPGWVLESPQVFYMVPVVSPGVCPFGSRPIYRAYNLRAQQNDSNHRYTAAFAIYQQMLAAGWKGEGVVFCSLE
ncbi:MAG: hypothetical protein ABI831_05090 [Betaproteobacteria bacterium]